MDDKLKRPGGLRRLEWEDFKELSVGSIIRVYHRSLGYDCMVLGSENTPADKRRVRLIYLESFRERFDHESSLRFLTDMGVIPYSENNWNPSNWTELIERAPNNVKIFTS